MTNLTQPQDAPPAWTVYVLRSTQLNRTYVGITVDIERRLAQHNGDLRGGARATRAGRPWEVAACFGPYPSKSQALRVERQIKRRRGAARLRYSAPAPEPLPSAPDTENASNA
ncbi:MAG: GIY-YIG nuclease family protein [Myxococcota bacterium]